MPSQKENIGSRYSKIIAPEDYNRLMSSEHLYIHVADVYIARLIQEKTQHLKDPEIVEIGCGPARILPMVLDKNPHGSFSAIDLDLDFIDYARSQMRDRKVTIRHASAMDYQHTKPVDIFYSEGFHHHIAKGAPVHLYLSNVYSQLKEGGYYIVGDEFIPDYNGEHERQVNLVIWYCHIIDHALRHGFSYLAQEEAKTFLDDLYEGESSKIFKRQDQIDFVLASCKTVAQMSKEDIQGARFYSESFLKDVKKISGLSSSGDDKIDLSRGDYKISDSVFRQEVESVGFVVASHRAFGPLETIGGMVVYALRKE